MICRISGIVKDIRSNTLIIDIGDLSYEVMVPETVAQAVSKNADKIELITYHYYQTDPSKAIPVLIGFMTEVEKEFFEQFIKVSGIGPKAAIKAFVKPVSQIARAIDLGDVNYLRQLPGIGPQRAKEIIAKLQGKVGKYGLIKDKAAAVSTTAVTSDIRQEALEILLQLEYKRQEAEAMIENALSRNQALASAEEILNEVYRQRIKEK